MVSTQERIRQIISREQTKLLAFRRHLHQNPELSYQEIHTSAYIKAALIKAGIPVQGGYAIHGLRARIGKRDSELRTVLRADMDALPIQEETGLDFSSKIPGIMHACGHDTHCTMVYAAGLVLHELRDELAGEVVLLFQPAEEKAPGGAKAMIADGFFTDAKPGSIWGQHVNPGLPAGVFGFRPGRMMAAVDDIRMTVSGHGGHAAAPHLTADPVHAAAHIITALQSLVSRASNPDTPTVLSFGRMEANGTFNIIPDTVVLSGTFRTVDPDWRKDGMERIRHMAGHIAEAFGCTVDLEVIQGYPPVDNNYDLSNFARDCALEFAGPERVVDLPLVMWAEDFAYYSDVALACFYNLGISADISNAKPLHNSRLLIDEEAILEGAAFMAYLAIRDLERQAT